MCLSERINLIISKLSQDFKKYLCSYESIERLEGATRKELFYDVYILIKVWNEFIFCENQTLKKL